MIWIEAYLVAGLVVLLWVLVRKELQSMVLGARLLRLSSGKIRDDLLTVLGFVSIVVAWPFFVWWSLGQSSEIHSVEEKPKPFAVEREDLVEQMTIDEIESRERVIDPLDAVPDGPFGYLNTAWLIFKSTLAPNDVLWSFRATRKDGSWEECRAGYAVVRNDTTHRWFLAGIASVPDNDEMKDVEWVDVIDYVAEQLPAGQPTD